MDVDRRQSATLPPIGSFRSKVLREEEEDFPSRRPGLPALDNSATSMLRSSYSYHAPHPYSEHFNNTNSATNAAHSLASFAQRRSSEETDPPNTTSQGARCSLPSLYEALGMDKGSPRGSSSRSSAPILPRTSQNPETTSPTSHSSQQALNLGHGMHDRDVASDWNPSRTPYVGRIGPASPVLKPARIQDDSNSASPHPNHQEARSHTQPIDHFKDDKNTSSSGHNQNYSQLSSDRHTPHTKDPISPSYSPIPIPRQPPQVQRRRSSENSRPSGIRKQNKTTYGESVKRHLEVFDLEQALNGVYDASKQLLEFSDFYRQKAHQTQRSGPLPGSTPHIQEIDDMMENGSNIHDALNCIREVVVNQQAALAERSREHALKSVTQPLEDRGSFHEESKDGTFIGSDPKRRRGRAAPPGRCHSCNRAETPEWRRGPDGARTLCNACGLHYAKLTRKIGAAKSSTGSSNLRPKVAV